MRDRKDNDNNYSQIISLEDTLDNVEQQFDLVVGNPPHWSTEEYARQAVQAINNGQQLNDRVRQVLVDKDWAVHKSFFKNMKRLLKPDGHILLQENSTGSDPRMFNDMLKGTGLKVLSHADSIAYKELNIYYLEIGHD